MGTKQVYRGSVVSFNPEKRTGFIRPEMQTADVLFHLEKHYEAIEVDDEIRFLIPNVELRVYPDAPEVGDIVVFMSTEGEKGPRATHWDFDPTED